MSQIRTIPTVIYDLLAVSRFCRSVALIASASQHTKLRWEEYRDSKVLNAIYTVFFWKGQPGYMVVEDDSAAIQRLTNQKHTEYLLNWLDILHERGPQQATAYMDRLATVRQTAQEHLDWVYREARDINAAVINETNQGIRNLAAIKLTAQVGVAAIGGVVGVGFATAALGGSAMAGGGLTLMGVQAGAGSLTFAGAGLAHSMSHSLIKNWEAGATARVAGISVEALKSGSSEVLGEIGATQAEKGIAQLGASQAAIATARRRIAEHSRTLARTARNRQVAKATRGIATNQAAIEAQNRVAQQAAGRLTAGGAAALGIPVIFAGWDILEAYGDYSATVDATR